ncbi:MAG: hypothetical protein CLLPBCKN_006866 [Chroococcidiopsis cubana SAG 39.79]|uniref:CIS tube protein n=1 Tax=Chroococcidiopsis cubana TaxID=171392 RepID=UPI002AC68C8E|nr:hypothetical protein [Chroococcidiopsis cubana]MDZ4877431.1 hypothetical protein [Chroococcidiopsis cubana SAG 39.79]
MEFLKAKLKARDSGGGDIAFMYNPTELSFTRTASWAYDLGHRGSNLLPKVNFSGVQPYRLTLRHVPYDTYEKKTSVMEYINKIKKGMSASADLLRPPVYTFEWGETKYSDYVIEDLAYTITMVLPNGTPVRAWVDITLLEVDSPKEDDLLSESGQTERSNNIPILERIDPDHPAVPSVEQVD